MPEPFSSDGQARGPIRTSRRPPGLITEAGPARREKKGKGKRAGNATGTLTHPSPSHSEEGACGGGRKTIKNCSQPPETTTLPWEVLQGVGIAG